MLHSYGIDSHDFSIILLAFLFPMADTPKDNKDTYEKLDDAFAEASVEEQLSVFWSRNKNFIIGGVSLFIIIVLGQQGFQYWTQKTKADLSASYAAAEEDVDKELFADRNSSTDLGGVAYIELADKAYEAGEFAKAQSLYEKSYSSFSYESLKGRSELGQGICKIQLDDNDGGVAALDSVSSNVNYTDVIRAEAYFQKSIVAWKQGDFVTMLSEQEALAELSNTGVWGVKADNLQKTVAELKALIEAEALVVE